MDRVGLEHSEADVDRFMELEPTLFDPGKRALLIGNQAFCRVRNVSDRLGTVTGYSSQHDKDTEHDPKGSAQFATHQYRT